MKSGGYTQNILSNLCNDPKAFCDKKIRNKYITNKYCSDLYPENVMSGSGPGARMLGGGFYGDLSPYYKPKCESFGANPSKNPFNKTKRGKHMKAGGYTEKFLHELCKDPKALCDKKKNNKSITKKYCDDKVLVLQEQVRDQISQIMNQNK